MKLIIKNFVIVLTRFRTSSILNILGLSVAYAVFFMIIVQAHYDFSFDRNFKNADSIFLYSRIIPNAESLRAITNTVEPRECAERYPEVKNFCYLCQQRDENVSLKDSVGNVLNGITLTYVSVGFIDMFKPKIIIGDVRQAFSPGKSMITESTAKRVFGNDDPIGKSVTNWGQLITVAAVCADFSNNCSLKNGIYSYQREISRNHWDYTTYLEINPKDKEKLLKAMNEDKYLQRETDMDKNWQFELTALPEIHLHFPAKGEGNLTTTVSLLAIGILLLIISYINFLNFSIAMAPVRVKSFNIRRILGESAFALKLSIVMEAVFLSLIAFFIAILIIDLMNNGVVNEFLKANLSISQNQGLLLLVGIIALISGFLAGLYPAFYTTSFKPAMALSGSFSVSMRSKWLKNMLIGTQFVAAIFLIIVTLFIKVQHDYLQNKSWGINTENILYLNTKTIRMDVENLIVELKKRTDIVDATAGAHFPGEEGMQGWTEVFEEKNISMSIWYVSPELFDFFGINTVEGRRFEKNDANKMIFNQAFSREYGLNNIIGKTIEEGVTYEIVGIVEDFNFKSLREPVKPLAFIPITNQDIGRFYNWTFIKTTGQNTSKTIDYIRDTWKKFSNEPVEVLFLDETLNNLYKKENNLAKLVSTCGAIAIIVAIMGLYGLILFNAKAKRKNIAIRKVHGASKTEVILMLNNSLLVQFLVAYVISVPVAYYVVNRWLEGFAYKTPMYWWVFILGGIIVLIISVITVSWESYKAASVNPVDGIKSE